MKRWQHKQMQRLAQKEFGKTYRRKKVSHYNHEIHILKREVNDWLPQGIQSLLDGTYTPRYLKRYYFPDETVDTLHVTDRIFQHVLLRQLKTTTSHIINSNCYHMLGPSGVKRATANIERALETKQYNYFIRVDIKSFYASIPHYKLVNDIKKTFDDVKVQAMLERIITNGIETPRGYQNKDCGIALRGPLSQLFSGIYLKPLDDAFNNMDVTYTRYQDDILILCKTKRQLNRCWRKIMTVLQERRLKLSRKKSRKGEVNLGFHFLGINYLGTQPQDNTKMSQIDDERKAVRSGQIMTRGGVRAILHCNIISLNFSILNHMREQYEKHVSELD